MSVKITAPQMGESITEATVATWLKQEGDYVERDEVVAELETDKVNLEVNAPESGILSKIVAQAGATVNVGDAMAEIDESADGSAKSADASESKDDKPAKSASTKADVVQSGGEVLTVEAPAMGESISEATVASWSKKVGDAVAKDEIIAELETDKVNLEVISPENGTLTSIIADAGATVTVGQAMAEITTGAVPAAPAASPSATNEASSSDADYDKPLSPAVRKMVEENGLDPNAIPGTGKDGRLTKGDVLEFMKNPSAKPAAAPQAGTPSAAPSAPVQVPAKSSGKDEDRVPMSRLRQTIAGRLKTAQNNAAMLTTYNEVDLSAVMAIRNQYKDKFLDTHGVKLGFMSFFTKATIEALKAWPALNAEIDGDELVYKKYYDMGIAVSSPKGLVVPVIRDADKMSLAGIEQAIVDMGTKARDGKLTPSDMTGATFTITNGGVFGSMMSMPILNYPQVGILGMHAIKERPVVVNGEIVIRPMMYLALTYDHRIVDGREAVSFLVKIKESLEDPSRMLLGV